MTRRRFLAELDEARVERAIAEAEQNSTGEIRVSIAGLTWGRSRALAERAFARLGMHRTRDRNGVLLLVVPWRRELVALGDEGVNARVDPGFWDRVVADAAVALHAGRYTDGICAAVAAVGAALAAAFPAAAAPDANANELPDRIG